jgi:hypothetical protein
MIRAAGSDRLGSTLDLSLIGTPDPGVIEL